MRWLDLLGAIEFVDILLPASMDAEMEDMILSWGHLYLTYNTKCADSPGEAISNKEIFRQGALDAFNNKCDVPNHRLCDVKFCDFRKSVTLCINGLDP